MADQHVRYDLTHPGWSFHGKIWSAPAPLYLPEKRRIAHAKARDYTAKCPATKPGEYCPEDGNVVPRGGVFPDGVQPPGTQNWTRPLAMEPILLGLLIGPDGEIREHLPLKEAPKVLIDAIVASEDADFYQHSGVNFKALIRAAWANFQGNSYKQGASTITMQVVRNLNQQKKKTIHRKIREILAALAIDQHLGKDGIMQIYLDAPYLGQADSYSICGFSAAAKHYWGIDIADITLEQAATLVGILPSPGQLRPDLYPQRAKEKRNRVLRRMAEKGWRVEDAIKKPLVLNMTPFPKPKYPAYLQYTLSWLKDNVGEETMYSTGLEVFTNMDLVVQQKTEETFQQNLPFLMKAARLPQDPPLEAAATVVDPRTGDLIAIYGGTIDQATDFSRATQAKRQAGSAFKPVVYALAFSQLNSSGDLAWNGFSTVRNDYRTFENTDNWKPKNISGMYSKKSTLAAGLTWSQNVTTASLLELLDGPQRLINFATRLGFDTSQFPKEMGLALGQAEVTPLEMTRFIATVANGGNLAKGLPINTAINIKKEDVAGENSIGARVLTQESAALTRELMRLVIRYGTGGASRGAAGKKGYRGLAIGKTGTTDKNKDVWFMGSTPTYSGALWLGYDQPHNMRATASDLAAPMWGWWMKEIHDGIPMETEFAGLQLKKTHNVCSISGKRANSSCRYLPVPIVNGKKSKGFCKIEHPKREKGKYLGLWRRKEQKRKEAEEKRRLEKEQQQQQKIKEWQEGREKEDGPPIPFEKPEQKN